MYLLCFLLVFAIPLYADDILRKAEKLFESASYEEAVLLYEQIDPLPSEAYSHLLYAYYYSKQYQKLIDRPLPKNPPFDQLYLYGLAHLEIGGKKEARSYLQPLLLVPEYSTQARLALARVAEVEGDRAIAHHLALTALERIVGNDSLAQEAHALLGTLYFDEHNYIDAIASLEKAPHDASARYLLALSYLETGVNSEDMKLKKELWDKAEMTLRVLWKEVAHDSMRLAVGYILMMKAKYLHDESAAKEIETVLASEKPFSSIDAEAQALLCRAEAAASYEMRDCLYRQLTQDTYRNTSLYPLSWYYRGIHDFKEGQIWLTTSHFVEAYKAFERATSSLEKAVPLLYEHHSHVLGYLARARFLQGKPWEGILTLNPGLYDEDPTEALYWQALLAAEANEIFLPLARINLLKAALQWPEGSHAAASLYLLGVLALQKENFEEAESLLAQVADIYPHSREAGDALFFAAAAADALHKEWSCGQAYRLRLCAQYPKHSHAAEAYFSLFSYADYLIGNTQAIEHAKEMSKRYPESPLVVTASYLIGLNYKRLHTSKETREPAQRHLLNAIDSFQIAEQHAENLIAQGTLTQDQLEYLLTLRYRATLERVLTNVMIAEESQGAKKKIYSAYALDTLQQVVKEFHEPENLITHGRIYVPLQEEAEYLLAHLHLLENHHEEAEQMLDTMLEKYQSAKITRGHFLARVWIDKGELATKRNDYTEALRYYDNAEDAAKGRVLGQHQQLDLWIKQSDCYRNLGKLDTAMTILSKVINADVVSGLRVKAMFLRAEIYELQGRQELALQQLKTTATKGGIWAQRAQQRLQQN